MIFEDEKLNEFGLLLIADSILTNPSLLNNLNKYYKTNKFMSYERAKRSEFYKHNYAVSRKLKEEIELKRVFGILLCVDEDEHIKKDVLRIFINNNIELYKLLKNNIRDLHEYNKKKLDKVTTYQQFYSIDRIPLYLIYLLDFKPKHLNIYNKLKEVFLKEIKALINLNNVNQKCIDEMEIPIRYCNNEFVNMFGNVKNLVHLCDYFNTGDNVVIKNPNMELFINKYKYLDNPLKLQVACINVICESILELDNLSLIATLGEEKIDIDEVQSLIKIIHNTEKRYDYNLPEHSKLDMKSFTFGVMFWCLVKQYNKAKQFYFENNDETQFLEMQLLQTENEKLKEEVSALKSKITNQEINNQKLKNEYDQKIKILNKPQEEQIRELNDEIKKLKNQLKKEQEKTPELNALREFMFDIESDYVPQETNVNFLDFINNKKIVIVGGYEGWKTKIKEKYPNLIILDGHTPNLDIKFLLNATFIFFNTSYMSHTVYYKIIDFIKECNIPFGYLGRQNQKLVEKEILDIMMKKV